MSFLKVRNYLDVISGIRRNGTYQMRLTGLLRRKFTERVLRNRFICRIAISRILGQILGNGIVCRINWGFCQLLF
jgi:hypothetical protein